MARGLGLLFAGLSGAAKGLSSSLEREQKVEDEKSARAQRFNDEKSLMEERSRLEEERMLRVDAIKTERTRSAGIKQGQEIEGEVTRAQNERITSKAYADEGPNLSAEDVRNMRDKPGGSRITSLLNSTRQTDLEDRAGAASKLGYEDAAKWFRTDARLDAADKHTKFMENLQIKQDARAERLARAELDYRKSRADKEDSRADQNDKREARLATSKNLDSVNSDIKALEKAFLEAKKNLDNEGAKEIDVSLRSARLEAAGYRKALASVGIKTPDAAPDAIQPITSTPPDGTRLRKAGQMYVVRNGIPVLESE